MFPRYCLESIGIVGIAGIGFFQQSTGAGQVSIPLIGALALCAQRLLPALQQIYSGWANFRAGTSSIWAVLSLLDQPYKSKPIFSEPTHLRKTICFDQVRFRYLPDHSEVLQGLDLEINRGERVGLVGTTGSGKSTVADMLMGLLAPSDGQVLVDGFDVYDPEHPERLTAWRATIANVPQNIFLTDSSIAENIAFGVPRHQIDLDRVKQAADQAQISSFIEAIPAGYQTLVGERGVRLSGGQRQRIGIARALYKQASVLVFDEATSALDTRTEEAVMDSVNGLSKDLTIIIIAHRLATIMQCDRLIQISNGVVSAQGNPESILGTSD